MGVRLFNTHCGFLKTALGELLALAFIFAVGILTHHTLGAEEELKTFGVILTFCTLNGCDGLLMSERCLAFAQIIDCCM